jgi:hypothetical protein
MDLIRQLTVGNVVVHKDGHHFRVSDRTRECVVLSRSMTLRSLTGFYEEGPRGALISVSMEDGVSVGKRLTYLGVTFVVNAFSREHGIVVLSETRIIDDTSDWKLSPRNSC